MKLVTDGRYGRGYAHSVATTSAPLPTDARNVENPSKKLFSFKLHQYDLSLNIDNYGRCEIYWLFFGFGTGEIAVVRGYCGEVDK
jgi:hypothetical protein